MTNIIQSQFSGLPEKYQHIASDLLEQISITEEKLLPAGREVAKAACILMGKHFRPQADADAGIVMEGYITALAELPEWAIAEAINCFISGLVENHSGQFMPTSAEFAKVARAQFMPVWTHWRSLRSEVNRLEQDCRDEQRRIDVEAFRNDPDARNRILLLIEDATKGLPSHTSPSAQHSMTDEQRSALDPYRAPVRPHQSKIGHQKKL